MQAANLMPGIKVFEKLLIYMTFSFLSYLYRA